MHWVLRHKNTNELLVIWLLLAFWENQEVGIYDSGTLQVLEFYHPKQELLLNQHLDDKSLF